MPIPKETVSDLFGQSMQAQLAKAGINLKITYMEQAAQLDLVYSRRRNQPPPWDLRLPRGERLPARSRPALLHARAYERARGHVQQSGL